MAHSLLRLDSALYPVPQRSAVQISSVQVSGGGARQGAVSTDTPRTEAAALWLQYTAIDAAGNVGIGLRQVLVVCPGEETVCFEDDSARPSACSVGGRCIDASLAAALGEQAVRGPALCLERLLRPASVGIRCLCASSVGGDPMHGPARGYVAPERLGMGILLRLHSSTYAQQATLPVTPHVRPLSMVPL